MTTAHPTELVVVQPTPFCNLDCTYCYLPNRSSRERISAATVRAIAGFLAKVPTFIQPVPIVWHAGEPTVLPRSFYETSFSAFEALRERGVQYVHSMQTNGTLINHSWCEFFRQHEVRIGVSIDGPAFLHDQHRVDRRGHGSFARTMRGVTLLREYGIPFSVICVLTRESLCHARELWEFFESHGITSVGFNIEEIEGAHKLSSLTNADVTRQYERFFDELYSFTQISGHPRVREIDETGARLRAPAGSCVRSSENSLGAILNFDAAGGISMFSPELLTAPPTTAYPSFVWGNVHTDTYEAVLKRVQRSAAYQDMRVGIEHCRTSCDYFTLCGGGAPSNKLGELGTLTGTETMACRLQVKALTRVVLTRLEKEVYTAAGQIGE